MRCERCGEYHASAYDRIACALERIADALELACTPEDEPEPEGCPHPEDKRRALNGWNGYECGVCEARIGAPIVRTR
jgi:hypothetical protein